MPSNITYKSMGQWEYIRDKLHQPHPGYADLQVYFRTIIGISLIVFLILFILEPFSFDERSIKNNTFLTALVYAGIAFSMMLFSTVWLKLFPKIFAEENWTLGRELLYIAYQMVSVALAVWLFNALRGLHNLSEYPYLYVLLMVFSVGILPYSLITIFLHNLLLRRNLQQASDMNRYTGTTELEQQANQFLYTPKLMEKIRLEDFYYAESRGNDLLLLGVYEGQVFQYTIRSTLNQFEEDNKQYTSLFRCHRSFLINMGKIQKIEGNASGFQVLLYSEIPPVVVSRTRTKEFKSLLLKKD